MCPDRSAQQFFFPRHHQVVGPRTRYGSSTDYPPFNGLIAYSLVFIPNTGPGIL